MEKNRNGRKNLIGFLSLAKNITLIIITSLIGIGLITILNSDDTNIITASGKNIANAQLEDSTSSQNIVDLKVSERNNNFVWTSVNGQVNSTLNLKSGTDYTIQVECMAIISLIN
jgi:hypothetical protein